MPFSKSFALAEESRALTGDRHADAASKANVATARNGLVPSRHPRCPSEDLSGAGRMQNPDIDPIGPGIAECCKQQDGQTGNAALFRNSVEHPTQ
jgi:hypothetical protein